MTERADDRIRRLAEANFGPLIHDCGAKNATADKDNAPRLQPGERIINVGGIRMRAIDLGAKGVNGIFEMSDRRMKPKLREAPKRKGR